GLGKGKRQKNADGKEGNQGMGFRVEQPNQETGQERQQQNAVRKHQLVAQAHQLAGHVAVVGQNGGKPREARKAGVGGRHQEGQRGGLDRVIQETAAAENGAGNLGHDGFLRLRQNAVDVSQESHPDKNQTQNQTDQQNRFLRVFGDRFLENLDPVRNRLNP